MQQKLYLFIEGEWDNVFFKIFLDDYLCNQYGFEEITYIEFSQTLHSREALRKLVGQEKVNFLLCPDLDARYDKQKMIAKIKKLAEEEFNINFDDVKNKSFVIVQEIESWYLAGFKKSFCDKQQITFYPNTEDANKGTFLKIAKQLKKTPLRLRFELTQTHRSHFSIDEAKQRNKSFRKFLEKVDAQIKRLS
ncbi:MAG: hypothetical protein RL329_2192 [Bacteroidota bacterium]|jgi:hypothetical protein